MEFSASSETVTNRDHIFSAHEQELATGDQMKPNPASIDTFWPLQAVWLLRTIRHRGSWLHLILTRACFCNHHSPSCSILLLGHWMRFLILLQIPADLVVKLLLGRVEALAVSLGLVHEAGQFFAHREVKGMQARLIKKRARRMDAVSRHLLNRRGLRRRRKWQHPCQDKGSQLHRAIVCREATVRPTLGRLST